MNFLARITSERFNTDSLHSQSCEHSLDSVQSTTNPIGPCCFF